jgi:TonB-dependent receptor
MTVLQASRRGASVAVIAAALSAGAAHAQHQVTGRVTDANGAALPGARVILPDLDLDTRTDRHGNFSLPSVPAGEVSIRVEYLGLPASSRGLNVSPAARNHIEFTLGRTEGVEQIVVLGSIMDGAARALNQQRTADNLTNVVSADSIGRFPDYNIAEALQRVPGIGVERDQGEGNFISLRGAPSEFTSITIDGVAVPSSSPDTRAVDLGVVPSDVVNGLEISKTLLPSQDADSIAGSVNLVTRSPFDTPRLRVNGTVGASYNDLGNTSDQRGSVVISNVFGPENRFGALVSASWSQTDRRVDNIENVWDVVERPEGDEILGVIEQEFKDYDTRRERIGLTGALEYRPDDASRFFLRGTFSRRTDDEDRHLFAIVYEDGDLQPGATEQAATWTRGRFHKEYRRRILRDETATVAAGGEHDLTGMTLDYAVSFARSEQTYPRRQQLRHRSNVRPDLSYDFSASPDRPALSMFQTGEHLDAGNYDFRQSTVRWTDTVQEEIALEANLEIPAILFGRQATHQFGVRARFRDVESDDENYRDRSGAAEPAEDFAYFLSGTPSDNFGYDLGSKYDSGRTLDYFHAIAPVTLADEGARRMPQSVEADYSAEETIYAAYGMTRVEFGRADLIVGLRVERTEFEGAAPNFNEETDELTLNHASNSYTNLFPNITLRYELTDSLIARAAVTRGISRPNYRDNVPRVVENSDGEREIIDVRRGNPDLQPTLSNNFDASLEYYFEPAGLLSANVFYKDLEDYEFTLVSRGEYNGQPANITEKLNADDARIYGFELAYQQQFVNLPGLLSHVGVFANYTWADAELTLPFAVEGRGRKAPLPDFSRETINLGVFYETGRFNARLAWTDRGDYVDDFNLDARLDSWWEGREQLDFTASYDVTDQVNVFLEAKNLTNSPGVRYAGVRSRPTEIEEFGYTVFLGARFNY